MGRAQVALHDAALAHRMRGRQAPPSCGQGLLLGPLPQEGAPPDEDPIHEPLGLDETALIARSRHPLLSRAAGPGAAGPPRELDLRDLAGCEWILAPAGSPARARFDTLFRARGLDAPVAAIESDDVPFLLSVVSRSDLLTALPRSIGLARRLGIGRLPVDATATRRTVGMTRCRSAALPPDAEILKDALREGFAGIGGSGPRAVGRGAA